MAGELRGGGSAADQLTVRRNNLSVVLSHLRHAGPRSRARVAEETGLNKATVSSLVAELVERGLVLEGETERGAVGRPGQTIAIDGRGIVAAGVEINIDYIAALVLNLTGDVLAERRLAMDTAQMTPDAVLKRAARLVADVLRKASLPRSRTVGVTVAVPGLVEAATGTLHEAPNLGWHEVAIVNRFRQLLHEPDHRVLLDNEANLAALAEIESRGAAGGGDLILLTGAAGVGGGIIAGGRLLRGGHGFAGEVGHIQLDPAGERCGCGRRGCWETLIGLNALLSRAANANDPVRDPSLDVEQRLAVISARAGAGDAKTLRACEEVGTWLGRGASILLNLFNPDVLVLGGYLSALGPWLTSPLQNALADQVFAPNAGGCRVELSRLGFSAAIRGGALQALEAVFDDPTMVEAA